MRPRLIAAAAGLLFISTTACAGPHPQLNVGLSRFATNIVTGTADVQAAPPVPPGAMTVAPPAIGAPLIQPSYPSAPPATAPALPACPAASPFAVALLAPTATIANPPKPATYVYRNNGTYKTSGAVPMDVPYPPTSKRVVQNVSATTTGGFTFQVVNTMGSLVATTTYQYVPPSAGAVNASTPTAGLYVTGIKQTNGKTTISDFTATGAGLLLLQVPAVAGQQWTTTATDATTGATITEGVTEGTAKTVNACGQVINALTVHVDGNIGFQENAENQHVTVPNPGPTPSGASNSEPLDNTSTTFVADYVLATQYGGLSVMDTVDETGTEAGVGVNSHNKSTINSVPKT
jgi:hypothetical protein